MTNLKRLAAPKWWPIERKIKKFIAVPRGPHTKDFSLPLIVLIRDILKLAETKREAKRVINAGEVLVDSRKMKDPNYGVGLFDVVEIPSLKKAWRAVPENGLSFVEIPSKESRLKICKIINKKTLKGNKNQLNLNDGRNILTKEKYSTHDSVLIQLPEQKIVDHLKFDKGSLVLVTRGKNAGKLAKIKIIDKNRLWLESDKLFEIPKNLVIVVGKEKPLITLK